MTTIEYRLVNADDIISYREIRLKCLQLYPSYFGTIYEDEVNATSLKFDNSLRQINPNAFLIGAFENSILIGICGFTQESRIKTRHRGEISQLFVKPEFSGQSIGSKLLQVTLDKAFINTAIEQIILGVVDTNENAIAIYKKAGFVEYGILGNYFKQEDRYSSMLFMVLTRNTYLNKINS